MNVLKRQSHFTRLMAGTAMALLSSVSVATTTCVGHPQATAPGDNAPSGTRLEQITARYAGGDESTPPAFMGTVLVARGDDVLLQKSYGKADVSWDAPNGPDVRYRLGSLTKQFTATLVLLLQEDGKLRLDDPVVKYLPDAPAHWRDITLSELMHHTSGIPDFASFEEYAHWRMVAHSHEEELAFFENRPLDFKPGAKFEYSNSNYEVLGVVIEKVSGRSYENLLRDLILQPLHMDATGLDIDGLILPKRAQGYLYAGDGRLARARSSSMTVPWAAGSMYSTSLDLLRWEHALFGGKILSNASLKAMTTPGLGGYGLGVRIAERAGAKVIAHAGGIEGFNTYLAYVPASKIAVVVLGNVNGKAPARMGGELVDAVLDDACGI